MASGKGVFKIIQQKTINSNAHLKNIYRLVKTNTNEVTNITPTIIKFTADQTIRLYSIYLKCRGATGTDGQIYLTCNTIDTDTINVGSSSDPFVYHKFTFSSPVTLTPALTTITITASQGSISIKSGSLDYSGWEVSES